MGSGCGDPIVERFLRPPGNSPSRWHLTQGLLLCSGNTIHEMGRNVNSFFKQMEKFIEIRNNTVGEGHDPPTAPIL